MELFRLFGSILIDDKDAIDKLKNTDKKAQETNSMFGKLAGGAAAVGTAVVGGATAAVGGLAAMVGKVTETTGQIADNAAKAGMSAEEYQKWKFAAEQSGMSMETLQQAMVRQQKAFSEAKTGNEALAGTYQQLGIDLSSVSNSEDAFNQTMAALAGVGDEAQRNALANDLFGKSYAELTPLLNEGGAGMDALKQKASDLGMVMSNDAVAQGEALGDTLDQIKGAAMGVFNSLGTTLVPIIQTFADLILDNMPAIQGLIAGIAPMVADFLAAALPMLMEMAQQIMPILFEVIKQLMPIIQALLPLFLEIVRAVLPPLLQLLQLLLPPLLQLLNMIIPPLTAVIRVLAQVFSGVLSSAIQGMMPVIDGLMTYFEGLITFITGVFSGNWKQAWEGIVQVFKGIWETMKAIFKAPINWIVDGINKFISGLNKIKIPDWVPAVGGKGINIPKIPRLKVGMDYVPSDYFPAFLDKGERVLTAEENREYSSGLGRNVTIVVELDGYTIGKAVGPALTDMIRVKTGLAF